MAAKIRVGEAYGDFSTLSIEGQQNWQMLDRAAFLDDSLAWEKATDMLDNYFSKPGSRANAYWLQMYLLVGGPAWQAYGWADRCEPQVNSNGSNGQFSCD